MVVRLDLNLWRLSRKTATLPFLCEFAVLQTSLEARTGGEFGCQEFCTDFWNVGGDIEEERTVILSS